MGTRSRKRETRSRASKRQKTTRSGDYTGSAQPDSDDNIDEWCVEGIPHLFSPDDDIAVDGVSAPDSDDNIDEWCALRVLPIYSAGMMILL